MGKKKKDLPEKSQIRRVGISGVRKAHNIAHEEMVPL